MSQSTGNNDNQHNEYSDLDVTGFEVSDYETPNYEGVRLMDITDPVSPNNGFSDPYAYQNNFNEYNQYSDETYDNYNNQQYDQPAQGERLYETSSYDQPVYDQATYNNPYNTNSYEENLYNNTQFNTVSSEEESLQENLYNETIASNEPFVPGQGQTFNQNTTTKQTKPTEDSIFAPLYPEGYADTPNPNDVFRAKPSNEDSLTEAELADIRRQKAAARRKKLAARERRRRERRKQAIIRCSILLAILILLIVGFIMLVTGIVKRVSEKKKERELSEFYATSEVTTEEPVADIDPEITAKKLPADREAALVILQEQAENDSTMQSICDSAAAIPDSLLQYLAVNPEMKDFTLNYPAKISITFDGDFSVESEGNTVPMYLQFDERWGYADYSEDIIGLRGSGPTALSMACTYLRKDGSLNPIRVADFATEAGHLDEDGKTHWSLFTEGSKEFGLEATEIDTKKDDMIEALEDGKLLLCKVSDGDFTTDESYILIYKYKNGFFYLNDPMSKARSEEGWDFKRLRGQIDKICVLEAGEGEPVSDSDSDSSDDSNTESDEDTDSDDSDSDENSDDAANSDDETENE